MLDPTLPMIQLNSIFLLGPLWLVGVLLFQTHKIFGLLILWCISDTALLLFQYERPVAYLLVICSYAVLGEALHSVQQAE